MSSGFNNSMDAYLERRRKKRLFSGPKPEDVTKKDIFSNKKSFKFSELKEKMFARPKYDSGQENSKKEISQQDIDELIRQKGTAERPTRKSEKYSGEEDGWEEVSLEEFGAGKAEAKASANSEKKQAEKRDYDSNNRDSKLPKSGSDRKTSSDSLKIKNDEKMLALKKKAADILFKKEGSSEKSIPVPSFRRGVLPDSIRDSQPKMQNIAKPGEENKRDDYGQNNSKNQEAKKSFLSKFIQVKTSSELANEKANEEEKKIKLEEEKAIKDQAEINQMLVSESQQQNGTADTAEEPSVDFSGLFREEEANKEKQTEEQKEGNAESNKSEEPPQADITLDTGGDFSGLFQEEPAVENKPVEDNKESNESEEHQKIKEVMDNRDESQDF